MRLSKGKSGWIIALNKKLKTQLIKVKGKHRTLADTGQAVIQTQCGRGTASLAIGASPVFARSKNFLRPQPQQALIVYYPM